MDVALIIQQTLQNVSVRLVGKDSFVTNQMEVTYFIRTHALSASSTYSCRFVIGLLPVCNRCHRLRQFVCLTAIVAVMMIDRYEAIFWVTHDYIFNSDRRLFLASGGEVLFTKMDQEAEMDIKVKLSFQVSSSSKTSK